MTRFVIFGTQRTGTNYLRISLDSHPEIRTLGEVLLMEPGPFPLRHPRGQGYSHGYLEYLKRGRWRQWRHILSLPRRRLVRQYLDELLGEQGVAQEVKAVGFSLKLSHVLHLPSARDYVETNRLSVILLQRRNVLRTHLSRRVSVASGDPHRTHSSRVPCVHVDTRNLVRDLEHIENQSEECKSLFPSLPRLDVTYEQLCSAHGETCSRLLAFLGVDVNVQLTSPLVKITPEKLADVVENHEDVVATLKRSTFADCL